MTFCQHVSGFSNVIEIEIGLDVGSEDVFHVDKPGKIYENGLNFVPDSFLEKLQYTVKPDLESVTRICQSKMSIIEGKNFNFKFWSRLFHYIMHIT